jgi:hypothetical protein
MAELTKEQIEAWRRWFHTGETTGEWAGTSDDLCDLALKALTLPEETFRDAERYRWLRLGNNRSAPTLGIWQEPGEGVETHYPCAEEGDAAIDAAMTAERIPQLSEGSK